jgi:hypothetical protein
MMKFGFCTSDRLLAAVASAVPMFVGGILLGGGCVTAPSWMALKPVEGDGGNGLLANVKLIACATDKQVQAVTDRLDVLRVKVVTGHFKVYHRGSIQNVPPGRDCLSGFDWDLQGV